MTAHDHRVICYGLEDDSDGSIEHFGTTLLFRRKTFQCSSAVSTGIVDKMLSEGKVVWGVVEVGCESSRSSNLNIYTRFRAAIADNFPHGYR